MSYQNKIRGKKESHLKKGKGAKKGKITPILCPTGTSVAKGRRGLVMH